MTKEININELGKRLKKAREEANLTQYQLSAKTGISTTQISAYENGKKSIGLYSLYSIADATGKTIDELYLGTVNQKPITSAKNDGELIVNCIDALYKIGVIELDYRGNISNSDIVFVSCEHILKDLLMKLDDLKKNMNNYPDPISFKNQLLAASIKRINDFIELGFKF